MDKAGRLWAGTHSDGICYIQNGQNIRPPKGADIHADVGCLFEDKLGRIWIGTDNGAALYDGKSLVTLGNQLEKMTIRCFADMDDGVVLAGGNRGLFRYHDGILEPFKLPGTNK